MSSILKYKKGPAHGLTALVVFVLSIVFVWFAAGALTALGVIRSPDDIIEKIQLSVGVSITAAVLYWIIVRNLLNQGAQRMELVGA